MSGKIIDGMLETPGGFVVPQLVPVENEAVELAQQYVEIWESVFNDQRTLRVNNRYFSVGRVTHSQDPMTKLIVTQRKSSTIDPAKKVRVKKDVRGLNVNHPDGDMSMAIDLWEQPITNLTDDPFAELIMNWFKRHLNN